MEKQKTIQQHLEEILGRPLPPVGTHEFNDWLVREGSKKPEILAAIREVVRSGGVPPLNSSQEDLLRRIAERGEKLTPPGEKETVPRSGERSVAPSAPPPPPSSKQASPPAPDTREQAGAATPLPKGLNKFRRRAESKERAERGVRRLLYQLDPNLQKYFPHPKKVLFWLGLVALPFGMWWVFGETIKDAWNRRSQPASAVQAPAPATGAEEPPPPVEGVAPPQEASAASNPDAGSGNQGSEGGQIPAQEGGNQAPSGQEGQPPQPPQAPPSQGAQPPQAQGGEGGSAGTPPPPPPPLPEYGGELPPPQAGGGQGTPQGQAQAVPGPLARKLVSEGDKALFKRVEAQGQGEGSAGAKLYQADKEAPQRGGGGVVPAGSPQEGQAGGAPAGVTSPGGPLLVRKLVASEATGPKAVLSKPTTPAQKSPPKGEEGAEPSPAQATVPSGAPSVTPLAASPVSGAGSRTGTQGNSPSPSPGSQVQLPLPASLQPASPQGGLSAQNPSPAPSSKGKEGSAGGLEASRGASQVPQLPVRYGQVLRGEVLSGVVLAEGMTDSPLMVRVQGPNGEEVIFFGAATLNPRTNRITARFDRAYVDNVAFVISGYLVDQRGTIGLEASVSEEAPNFAVNLVRGAFGGIKQYVDYYAKATTTTIVPGTGVVSGNQPPPLGLTILSGALGQFAAPPDQVSMVRVWRVAAGTPAGIIVVPPQGQ